LLVRRVLLFVKTSVVREVRCYESSWYVTRRSRADVQDFLARATGRSTSRAPLVDRDLNSLTARKSVPHRPVRVASRKVTSRCWSWSQSFSRTARIPSRSESVVTDSNLAAW
jgi:hypothetical protein